MALTIGQVKRINKEKGRFFFEPSAMRFFRSKVPKRDTELIGNKFFVTSEQFSPSSRRKFTVRKFDKKTGNIDTVGEFQQFTSGRDARNFAKSIVGTRTRRRRK